MPTTFADLGTLTFAGANWAWNDWPVTPLVPASTPSKRITIIPAENRTFTAVAENRTLEVT